MTNAPMNYVVAGVLAFAAMISQQAWAGPKYGAGTTRIFSDHRYLREATAPDFWALMPYYLPQATQKECSVATLAMVLNGVRAPRELTAADELVTSKSLVKRNASLGKAVGILGRGVSLEELGRIVSELLKQENGRKFSVDIVHVSDDSKETRAKLHAALVENEKSHDDFILLNFLQKIFTGDPEGDVGHIAPLAAFDDKTGRALILDPDRKYYEPYWVSEETLLRGMNTHDKTSKQFRGYIRIKALASP